MRTIRARLEMTLFEHTWDEDTVKRFHKMMNILYAPENFEVDRDKPEKAYVTVTTSFDDDESTGSTVAYCMGEDLADDMELDVLNVEAIEEELL